MTLGQVVQETWGVPIPAPDYGDIAPTPWRCKLPSWVPYVPFLPGGLPAEQRALCVYAGMPTRPPVSSGWAPPAPQTAEQAAQWSPEGLWTSNVDVWSRSVETQRRGAEAEAARQAAYIARQNVPGIFEQQDGEWLKEKGPWLLIVGLVGLLLARW